MSHADEIKIAYQWYRLLEWKRRKELNTKYGCSDDNITNDVVLEIYNAEHSKAHKPTEQRELRLFVDLKENPFPEIMADRNPGMIVIKEVQSVVFGTLNSQFNHLAERVATSYNCYEDLYNALKQLKIVAAETTSNLIAWDGAEPLDAAIDKAEKALNKAIGK